jgi:hypothetical protein
MHVPYSSLRLLSKTPACGLLLPWGRRGGRASSIRFDTFSLLTTLCIFDDTYIHGRRFIANP